MAVEPLNAPDCKLGARSHSGAAGRAGARAVSRWCCRDVVGVSGVSVAGLTGLMPWLELRPIFSLGKGSATAPAVVSGAEYDMRLPLLGLEFLPSTAPRVRAAS